MKSPVVIAFIKSVEWRDGSLAALALWDGPRLCKQTYMCLWALQARCTTPGEVGKAKPQSPTVTVKVDYQFDRI